VTPLRGRKVTHLPREWKNFGQLACYNLQYESSGWLFKSPLASGGGSGAYCGASLQATQLVINQQCTLKIIFETKTKTLLRQRPKLERDVTSTILNPRFSATYEFKY